VQCRRFAGRCVVVHAADWRVGFPKRDNDLPRCRSLLLPATSPRKTFTSTYPLVEFPSPPSLPSSTSTRVSPTSNLRSHTLHHDAPPLKTPSRKTSRTCIRKWHCLSPRIDLHDRHRYAASAMRKQQSAAGPHIASHSRRRARREAPPDSGLSTGAACSWSSPVCGPSNTIRNALHRGAVAGHVQPVVLTLGA
jgi:hypothetical protein